MGVGPRRQKGQVIDLAAIRAATKAAQEEVIPGPRLIPRHRNNQRTGTRMTQKH